jgi:hypothetical protein
MESLEDNATTTTAETELRLETQEAAETCGKRHQKPMMQYESFWHPTGTTEMIKSKMTRMSFEPFSYVLTTTRILPNFGSCSRRFFGVF